MSTPSIQTLITQAQQVLNLKSSNEIRATLAAVLANANVGTPLNPNLTTQQLWDEFYEIVRQPSDDIMSIITDQMMRMVFSPPAPGGAGADKQVIFNDGGVLAGDPDLIFNKALNKLVANNIETAAGLLVGTSATITGDLTVDTSTLKVDSTNNRVGIGTASPASRFEIADSGTAVIFSQTLTGAQRWQQIIDTTLGDFTLRDQTGAIDVLIAKAGTGNVNISTGNVVMATSGKGIDFSATANSSGTMTSELLNDYEEGTWTGTLSGGTTNPTIAVTTTGRYTKVGRVVTVQITFTNVNTLGASGLLGITGLPFTNNASVNSVGSVNFYNIATFTGSPFIALGASQSSLVCYSNISNSAFADVTHNASATANYFTASITYTV